MLINKLLVKWIKPKCMFAPLHVVFNTNIWFSAKFIQYFICIFNISLNDFDQLYFSQHQHYSSPSYDVQQWIRTCLFLNNVPDGSKHSFEFMHWSKKELFMNSYKWRCCHSKWKFSLKVKRKIASKINRLESNNKRKKKIPHTTTQFSMNNVFPKESTAVCFAHKKIEMIRWSN